MLGVGAALFVCFSARSLLGHEVQNRPRVFRLPDQLFASAKLKSVTTLHCSDFSGQHVVPQLPIHNLRFRKGAVLTHMLLLAKFCELVLLLLRRFCRLPEDSVISREYE